MNYRKVFKTIGLILSIESFMMLLPVITALIYKEFYMVPAYLVPSVMLFVFGALLWTLKDNEDGFYAKEGFLTVGLSWIIMSLFGCLPFLIGGEIPHFIDALFETVSGFTTTGASVVADVESLSHATLLWRSLTCFSGGMGILVFMLAILPAGSGSTMHIFRAETTGVRATKLVAKLRFTARILYLIYATLTLILIILLCFGMPFFDAVCHAFSLAGTGGFSTKNASIGAFNKYVQTVVVIFMLIYSINFSLFYLILIGRVKEVFKNEELRTYLIVLGIAIIIIALSLIKTYGNFMTALGYASFTAVSLVTTTGFFNTDFYVPGSTWPTLAVTVLLMLMIMGGMAGSTSGGVKVSRIGILNKSIFRDIRKSVKPNTILPLKYEGKSLGDAEIHDVKHYILLYLLLLIISSIIISAFGYSFETDVTLSISALSNVGPAFGEIGSTGYTGALNPVVKIVLIFDMLLGRLEILPIMALFTPATWRFKS